MAEGIPARLTAAAGRRFGLTVGIAFVLMAALLAWRAHSRSAAIAAVAGVALLLAAVIAPTRLGPVERGWMRLALALSSVTTPIILGLVYYVVVTPIGVVRRTIGRNPLRHAPAPDSRWFARDTPRGDLERQF
jgi:hypothetical protein